MPEKENPKMDEMLAAAGKRLGLTPQELGAALKKGDLNAALANMSPEDRKKFTSVMGNPETVARLMRSAGAMKLFGKNKKTGE